MLKALMRGLFVLRLESVDLSCTLESVLRLLRHRTVAHTIVERPVSPLRRFYLTQRIHTMFPF